MLILSTLCRSARTGNTSLVDPLISGFTSGLRVTALSLNSTKVLVGSSRFAGTRTVPSSLRVSQTIPYVDYNTH